MRGKSRSWSRRINDYDPAALDQLCLTGAIGWGRLSPHPATLEEAGEAPSLHRANCGRNGDPTRRRVVPTSVAPITFFVRDEATGCSRGWRTMIRLTKVF